MKIREFALSDISFSYTCQCGLGLILKGDAKLSQANCPSCGAESLKDLREFMAAWQRINDLAQGIPLKLKLEKPETISATANPAPSLSAIQSLPKRPVPATDEKR